jgi:hypothetical protein
MSTLSELRDMVEQDLDDAGNSIWSAGDIDRAIKRALAEYSLVKSREAVGTIELSADGREIDLSSLSGLTRVVRVWYPYDASAPGDAPRWVRWEKWGDTLYLAAEQEPASGEVVRVYYHQGQTIEGLDGASETSVPSEDEEVIVLGASGYAALQKARGSVGEAGVSTETPEHWLTWGQSRLEAFTAALSAVRLRELRKIDKRVPLDDEGWQREGKRGGI